MIERTHTTRMVAPRAEVEMQRDPDYPHVYYAKCLKCGKIIADSSDPLEVTGLKPEDVKSSRIMCHHRVGKEPCKHLNFVSHK